MPHSHVQVEAEPDDDPRKERAEQRRHHWAHFVSHGRLSFVVSPAGLARVGVVLQGMVTCSKRGFQK